jgi:anionic cell wall polymer biosynthesis LytR-Cps2A-Psr (LCP) family protein
MKYIDISKQQKIRHAQINKNPGKAKFGFLLLVFLVVCATFFIFKDEITSAFDPISIVSNAASANLKETDGRTNILLLGSDRRSTGNIQSELTDTILVASIGRVDNDVVLISLPRDLWVNNRYKINAVYAIEGGVEPLTKIIEDVLGIPIHYYSIVTFDMFEESINILGGINVEVENSFTDYSYPVEGMEANSCGRAPEEIDELLEEGRSLVEVYPCRYETISFKQGEQVMDGATALKYARSRKGDNGEGTDFARSKRQQNVIMAIKNKALSLETLLSPAKLKGLYETYSTNVETNITLSDIQGFYLLSQQIDFERVVSVVLDDRSTANEGGLLYNPQDSSLYGGQYVLLPRTGDYSQIHAFVQKYIFGGK